MSQVIDITAKRKEDVKKEEQIKLDAHASYTVMKDCLAVLELNNMPELRSLKAMMRRTMKDMVEIGKYGKKEGSR